MNLEERQNNLLKIIVEEYIESANPVGSSLIVEKYFKDLSSATIRNDMVELERRGLIYQPYTSAGRIPTLDGYKTYLDNFVERGSISGREKSTLDKINVDDYRRRAKDVAKAIAELSNNAVFIGFSNNDHFYTGISNLFRQPEFIERSYIYTMSDVIDHLDDVISDIYEKIKIEGAQALIGSDNPFGEMSSAIVSRCKFNNNQGMIGILGPNRMNYKQGIGLVDYARELFS